MTSVRASILLVVTLLVVSCGSTPPLPDDQYYRLAPAPEPVAAAQPVFSEPLMVELPQAAGVRRDRAVLYSEDPDHLRFKQYHYHHWEQSPPQLVQRRLIEALQAANVAETVTEQPRLDAAFRLRSELHRFERLMDGPLPVAMVEIEFRLLGADRAADPILSRSYRQQVTAADAQMESTVRAFSAALDQVIAELIEDLRQL